MRTVLVLFGAIVLTACGVPDIGCPATQPTAGSSCTSIQSCDYTPDGGPITCRCAVSMGSTDGTWQCMR